MHLGLDPLRPDTVAGGSEDAVLGRAAAQLGEEKLFAKPARRHRNDDELDSCEDERAPGLRKRPVVAQQEAEPAEVGVRIGEPGTRPEPELLVEGRAERLDPGGTWTLRAAG